MRILLVEDDAILADALSRALVQSAYAVDVVNDGAQADHVLALDIYDLAILDIGLPGLSGLDLLRRLRARKSALPVLMLTAFDTLADRVRGLDLGADDYLAKPFDLPELEARVRALIRRASSNPTPSLMHGKLRLDTAGRRVYYDEQPVDLSAREFAVLELLLLREGRVEQGTHGQPPVRLGRRGRRQRHRGLHLPHPQETRRPWLRDPHRARHGLPAGARRWPGLNRGCRPSCWAGCCCP